MIDETRPGVPRDGRLVGLVLAIALLAFVQGSLFWWPRTVDDAYIIFRYAQNLVEGLGPTFNPGEAVEGYTSPSFVLLMAGAIATGIDPVPAAKWAGLVASVSLLGLLFVHLLRTRISAPGASFAVLLVGSSFVFQIWSVSGLETNVYALLWFAGLAALVSDELTFRRIALASALLAAAALTRPEALLFWVMGLPLAVFRQRPLRAVGRRVAAYVVPGLVLPAHLLWRFWYYGDWLPNTYYVKTGGGPAMWIQGLHGLRIFVFDSGHWVWLLAAFAGSVVAAGDRARRLQVAVMAGAVITHLLYIVSVGDDGLRVHRFYVPVLAPLAVLIAQLFAQRSASGGRRAGFRALGVAAVLVAASISTFKLHAQMLPRMRESTLRYQEGNVRLGRHLARTREPGALIAVASAGAIPYYSRLPTIDMYGLSDSFIAHRPFPELGRGRLMKWDNAYVLSREPELIAINRGYFRAGDPLAAEVRRNPAVLAVAPMDRDLFQRIVLDGRYRLIPLGLEQGAVFYVFERTRAQLDR